MEKSKLHHFGDDKLLKCHFEKKKIILKEKQAKWHRYDLNYKFLTLTKTASFW
jgi:hypothetical protein